MDEEDEPLDVSALAKQITNIGNINIQELDAKMALDEEEIRGSLIETSKKGSLIMPKLNTDFMKDINIEEFDSDSDQETERDKQYFMDLAMKEMKEEQEKAKKVMQDFQRQRED
jgi:hypothetical protein